MFGGRPKARALVEEDARDGAAVLLPDPSRARRTHTDRPPTAHILGTDAMKPPQCPIALFTPPKAGLGFS